MRNTKGVGVVSALMLYALFAPRAGAPPVVATTTKTVGLAPPPACASTNSISVPSGTTVYYCYTITTAANVTLSYSLVDDQLGTITTTGQVPLGGTDRQFASANVTAPVTNVAMWETSVENGTVFGNATAAVSVSNPVPTLAPPALLALGAALLLAGLFLLRRIG